MDYIHNIFYACGLGLCILDVPCKYTAEWRSTALMTLYPSGHMCQQCPTLSLAVAAALVLTEPHACNHRFDRSIEVRRPDYQGRLEGIKVHLREKPIAADIEYAELAMLTGGMSGAQLAGKRLLQQCITFQA